jgi:adenylate cyclase
MFSYIFSHFFNHGLGNFSYDTMEAWLRFHVWWWRIPVVNFALYAAATTHFLLGLWALYQRRHFRYTVVEITQLVFGLSIPLLIASHFGIVRIGGLVFGRDPPIYAPPLLAYWVTRPYMVGVQFLLLTVAWTHACIGLYFWLRLKPFFKWAAPFLLAIAVLLPPLAMTHPSRRPRGDRTRVATAMACRTYQGYSARAARGDRRHHAFLLSDPIWLGDCAGVRGARRSRAA